MALMWSQRCNSPFSYIRHLKGIDCALKTSFGAAIIRRKSAAWRKIAGATRTIGRPVLQRSLRRRRFKQEGQSMGSRLLRRVSPRFTGRAA